MVEAKPSLAQYVDEFSPQSSLRSLPEIYRPHTKILRLSDFGERIGIDDQLVLSFRYLSVFHRDNNYDPEIGPTDNLLIVKRRGLYVVFPKSQFEIYDPPKIDNPDEIVTMFIRLRPRRDLFYAGEQYELGFLPEDDRQSGGPIDVLISSEKPINLSFLNPNERDHDFLKRAQAT